jgi:dTDP-4-amino-4,6-dideoxygalactose transaminase
MSAAPEPPPIPLFDLARQHAPLQEQLQQAVAAVAAKQRFVRGPVVARFEAAFAAHHGARHAVALSSGTDALLVALSALGIGPGDEVITTPFSFIATAEAVLRCGARPVFADIDPQTCLLDPAAVERCIGPRTRALLPVHLYGRACDLDAFAELARASGAELIEDCAQAFGARWSGRQVGRLGRCGAFSFFPTKNLGAWGDSGLLLTDDDEVADRARALRDHGADPAGRHVLLGGNFRMDSLQAAVLNCKLEHVERWLAERRAAAERYDTLLAAAGLSGGTEPALRTPDLGGPGEHSLGLYVVRTRDRDRLRQHLAAAGIASGVYYPRPLHLEPCLAAVAPEPGLLPAAERAAQEVLALPCFAGIAPAEQRRVVAAMTAFFQP